MKGLVREFIVATIVLIVLFLVLTHFTGFERDVRAIGSQYVGAVKALQGRG